MGSLSLAITAGCARKEEAPAPEPQAEAAPAPQSLYDRLGGEGAIQAVVDEFVANVGADARIGSNTVLVAPVVVGDGVSELNETLSMSRRPLPVSRWYTVTEAALAGVVKVAESDDYGKVLMSKGGLALYLFTKDGKGPSECYDDCAAAWPPFLTKGKPVAGKGVVGRKLGTVVRDDGGRQVTYGGHPLYFYEHDRPGEIFCQDVIEFGGTWLLVDKAGRAVR